MRGAHLKCSSGSHHRKLNLPRCHGVYIIKNPAMNSADYKAGLGDEGVDKHSINIPSFGVCKAPKSGDIGKGNISLATEVLGEDGLPIMGKSSGASVSGDRCQACFLDSNGKMSAWQNSQNSTKVGVENYFALTTNSFLACSRGGIISVRTSGQETVIDEDDTVQPSEIYGPPVPESELGAKEKNDDLNISSDSNKQDGKNINNMMQFFGVSNPDDVPILEDNQMVFMENVRSVAFGVSGVTIVMDNNKYCMYTFTGVSTSIIKGSLPYELGVTKGYVYNVNTPSDYEGAFLGQSTILPGTASGGAVVPNILRLPNGVYAEIISGDSWLAGSSGFSATYYFADTSDWAYGEADINWYVPRISLLADPFNQSPYL